MSAILFRIDDITLPVIHVLREFMDCHYQKLLSSFLYSLRKRFHDFAKKEPMKRLKYKEALPRLRKKN